MTRANELYQLLSNDQIVGSTGYINFTLANIDVEVEDVSVVGNILQEWLSNYMRVKDFYFRNKPNTQEFPDFLLDENGSNQQNLLEVKAFTKSPNFDVANFRAFARSLRENAYRLDADYLIFKYTPVQNGVRIDDIWLKKVWEITGESSRSDVKIQWKQSEPVNIRPITWYSDRAKFPPFSNRLDFVIAMNRVIGMASIDSSIQRDWLNTVRKNYRDQTGNEL